MLIIMKLHPTMQISAVDASHQCILHYNPSADIYPALSLFDILITNYSSIYFDYLLLDRPIIFFPYDFEQYISEEKKLLFDYHDMAPGPICATQAEVETAILQTSSNLFSKERADVLKLVFTHCDARASSRLWEIIQPDYLDDIRTPTPR